MSWRRGLFGVGVASSASCFGVAFYFRPDPSEGEQLNNQTDISRRLKSTKNLCDDAAAPDPVLLGGARALVISAVAAVSHLVLYGLNRTKISTDERHARLLQLVRNRPEGEPLLTVANHSSVLDDPGIVAAVLPWDVLLRPKLMRWAICSQEICFPNAAISTFFGAGKVLPIERGGSVDQKLLLDFSRRLATGDWCHIFPEGKTVQTGTLGGRSRPRSEEIGLLKWGVGKVVAHAPRTPRIIPFFHTGMQNLMPEDPVSKDVLPNQPTFFNDITVRVGDEVEVSDLIAAHEAKYGPLWKYSSAVSEGGEDDERMWASSSPEDGRLYSAITRRVQAALHSLEAEARAELGKDYPTTPRVVASGEYQALLARKK